MIPIEEKQQTLNSLCLTCINKPCSALIEMRKEEPHPFVDHCSGYNKKMNYDRSVVVD